MLVSTWSNGDPRPTGSGYGIRISSKDVPTINQYDAIKIKMSGEQKEIVVSVSASFGNGCHELRSAAIGRWMIGRGLEQWPKGSPHRLTMKRIHSNHFSLGVS